jgi:hypothetical protein
LRCGVVLILLGGGGCSRVFWRPDLGGGMRLAAERNQVVVVAYWSALNEDCMRMEDQVFSNPEVVKALGGTVPVRISALTSQRFAEDYGLTVVPSFVVFGPDGGVLRVAQGYMDEARFRGMVEAAKLSM